MFKLLIFCSFFILHIPYIAKAEYEIQNINTNPTHSSEVTGVAEEREYTIRAIDSQSNPWITVLTVSGVSEKNYDFKIRSDSLSDLGAGNLLEIGDKLSIVSEELNYLEFGTSRFELYIHGIGASISAEGSCVDPAICGLLSIPSDEVRHVFQWKREGNYISFLSEGGLKYLIDKSQSASFKNGSEFLVDFSSEIIMPRFVGASYYTIYFLEEGKEVQVIGKATQWEPAEEDYDRIFILGEFYKHISDCGGNFGFIPCNEVDRTTMTQEISGITEKSIEVSSGNSAGDRIFLLNHGWVKDELHKHPFDRYFYYPTGYSFYNLTTHEFIDTGLSTVFIRTPFIPNPYREDDEGKNLRSEKWVFHSPIVMHKKNNLEYKVWID